MQGIPSVLVRLAGCNLNCVWCDSPVQISEDIFIEELIGRISKYNCKYIILTGGEPLFYDQIVLLTFILKKQGYHITIETNATIKKPIVCDLVSLSPKLIHSGNKDCNLFNSEVVNYYIKNYNYQIKFVVRAYQKDFNEVRSFLKLLNSYDPERILIMPVSKTRHDLYIAQKKIIALCLKNGYRYANRLQLQIWNNKQEV